MFGNGDNIGACDFNDGDTAVGCVGGVQVNVVRADAGCNGELELLCLCKSLGSQVAGMEAVEASLISNVQWQLATLYESRLSRSNCFLSEWTYGVVMITSASTSSLSNVEFSPSLSDVVTKVWPWSSSHFRIPSSFSVVPSISGTSLACSWPYLPQLSTRSSNSTNWDQLDRKRRITYIVQDKQDFRLPSSHGQYWSRGSVTQGVVSNLQSRSRCQRSYPAKSSPLGRESGPGGQERRSRTREAGDRASKYHCECRDRQIMDLV